MTIRIVTALLVAVFVFFGGAKLAALDFEIEAFHRWGYPLWFMYATGAAEIAGAIGLLLPRLAGLAAACLTLLMVGALGTHLMHGEWPMAVVAATILALCAWRAWAGMPDRSGRTPPGKTALPDREPG